MQKLAPLTPVMIMFDTLCLIKYIYIVPMPFNWWQNTGMTFGGVNYQRPGSNKKIFYDFSRFH